MTRMCEACHVNPAEGEWSMCHDCNEDGLAAIAREEEFQQEYLERREAELNARLQEREEWLAERQEARAMEYRQRCEAREERRLIALAEKRWGFLREL